MTFQDLKPTVLQNTAGAISMMGIVGGIIGVSAVLMFAAASAEKPLKEDQIVASFERAFGHEPALATKVTRSAIDTDVLYTEINTIHWSTPEEQIDRMVAVETTAVRDPNFD